MLDTFTRTNTTWCVCGLVIFIERALCDECVEAAIAERKDV